MNEQIEAHRQKRALKVTLVTAVGFCLSLSAVIAACLLCLVTKFRIPIERPILLVVASVFVLLPCRRQAANTLQKVTVFYLVGVPVNELAQQSFQIPFLPGNISVSYCTVVLLLCAAGYLLGAKGLTNKPQAAGGTNILTGWLLAFVIIIIHIFFLSLILHKFYGYGYERNMSVIGNLCLYFLLFIFLWKMFDRQRFRQIIGLILAVFYFVTLTTVG